MNREASKTIKILCILSFLVVSATSIPLFVAYLRGSYPKYSIINDVHVWSGVIFVIFAALRIIRTKLRK